MISVAALYERRAPCRKNFATVIDRRYKERIEFRFKFHGARSGCRA